MSAAESTGFTPPAAFGPYRVLHQIGSGVLGPVFRTYDPQNDRLVAVKAFRLEIVPEDVARLAESLRRLPSAGLTHPGIVNAIDAGLEGMSAFLAMEYVSAETLDVALRHLAPAPLDRALPLIADIAEAIEAAWAGGCGHGSLHPRDVFVASGTNEVRVTGFGVGQALESAGIKVPPRRPYTAPERSTGGPWDIRADVYSLGAIAHELLTKRRPGGAGEQDGSLVTGTTPEQRRLIRGVLGAALAETPEHRFHSPRAFAEALGAIARGEAVGPLPEGPAAEAVEINELKVESTAEPKARPELEATLILKPEPKPDVSEPKKPAGRRSHAPAEKTTPLFSAMDKPAAEPPALPAEAPGTPHVALGAAHPAPGTEHVASPVHHIEIQHIEPISAHDVPRAAPAHEHPHAGLSITHVPTLGADTASPDERAPRFSWAAVAAGLVAGIFLGATGGYWLGLNSAAGRQVPAVSTPASQPASAASAPAPAAIPPGTDVTVKPEPVAPPPAAAGETPPLPDVKPPGKQESQRPPPPPPPPPPPVGRLVVRSTPADASVKIDGRARGTAPITVRDLTLGVHTVEVSRPGYATRTERVTLTAAATSKTLSLDLSPQPQSQSVAAPAAGRSGAAAAGSIYLDSRPAGAHVFLDGKDVGKTPTTLSDIKVGAHKLRFELAGYRTLDTSVTVRPGQQERVTVTLEQALSALLLRR